MQAHSAACRKRFEKFLADSDKVKLADYKIEEYLAKMLEREDEQHKIKRAKIATRSRRTTT